MSGRASLLRGVSSAWAFLLTVAVIQLAQIRIARQSFAEDEFVLFNVLANLVSLFYVLELGVRSAFARLLLDAEAEGENALNRLWSTATGVLTIQASAIVILGLFCLPFLPSWFDVPRHLAPTVRWVFACLCLLAAAGYAFGAHTVALIARQHFVLVNAIGIVSAIAGFFAFYIAIQLRGGLWSAVAGAIPFLLASAFVAPRVTRRLEISRPFTRKYLSGTELRRVFALGLDLFWIGLYNLVLAHTLLIFAGSMLPAAVAATFAVNLKFAQLALQAAQRIPGTAEPILAQLVAQREFARFREGWALSAKVAIAVTLSAAGLLYLWAGWAVMHWTSRADVMSGFSLLLLSLLPVRYIIHTIFVLSATIFKEGRRLRGALFAELCVYAVLASVLTPRAGVSGLLLANLLALPLGSLIPGTRILCGLGDISAAIPFKIYSNLLFPLIASLTAVAWLWPKPELLSHLVRGGVTFGWLLFAFVTAAVFSFSSVERGRIFDAFRSRFSRRQT